MSILSECPHCGASIFMTQPLATGGNAIYCERCGGAVDWPGSDEQRRPPDRMLGPMPSANKCGKAGG